MDKLLLILIIIAVLVFGPLCTIWALNQLFGFTIAYTFYNWLAVILLGGAIRGSCSSSSSSK